MYLVAAGVEPVLRDGSLRAHVKAELKPAPDGAGMVLSPISVSGVQLKQGGGRLIRDESVHPSISDIGQR